MNNQKRVKLGCYLSNFSMAVVSCISPLLFVTFHTLYDISYTLLGLLVLVNFVTQLVVDLAFTFLSDHININIAVKCAPALAVIGFLFYGLAPLIFPSNVYIGLVAGTVIFSAASGLNEVLISPIIASIPSDNKEKEMSFLHSIYAWGVVIVVIIGTSFLKLVGTYNWMYFAFLATIIPLLSFIFFIKSDLPDVNVNNSKAKFPLGVIFCAIVIFLGGASESAMTQWCSSYIENALGIPKFIGDIFGVALFGIMLSVGRTLYTKRGKNIIRVMLIGMLGSFVCYAVASLVLNDLISLIACILTGLFVAMLWPGTIIIIEEKYPSCGVKVFALMAACGDLGCAAIPQAVGVIIDVVSKSNFASYISNSLNITVEQVGMRIGMLFAAIFPLLGFIILFILRKYFKKSNV